MDMELERFADLLTSLIEKYADKIDLDSLPDPPRPTENKSVGFFGEKVFFTFQGIFYSLNCFRVKNLENCRGFSA